MSPGAALSHHRNSRGQPAMSGAAGVTPGAGPACVSGGAKITAGVVGDNTGCSWAGVSNAGGGQGARANYAGGRYAACGKRAGDARVPPIV